MKVTEKGVGTLKCMEKIVVNFSFIDTATSYSYITLIDCYSKGSRGCFSILFFK